MRRFFLLLALALTGALNCMAQLNGTGFYRFRNANRTTDYISIANDKFNYTTAISTACGGLSNALSSAGQARALECAGKFLETDIHLVNDEECINPGSVIYAQKRYTDSSNYEYNLIGQGTSLLTLTTGTYPGTVRLKFENRYATIKPASGSGANTLYTAMIELKSSTSVPFYGQPSLGTRYLVDDNGKLALNSSNSAQNARWYIEPVTHFNVKPEVKSGGKYYTTLRVPFAFTLSDKIEKAYAVTAIDTDGRVKIKKVAAKGGTVLVPAGTPVILECTSNVTADCRLIPTNEPNKPLFTAPDVSVDADAPKADTISTKYSGTNLLKGTYYCNTDGNLTYTMPSSTGTIKANHFTSPTKPQKYVLGLTSDKLGFVKATTAMPANKAWIEYNGSAEELVLALPGDVNKDGKVDSADLVRLVDRILQKENPLPCDEDACDVNEDGILDSADVLSLVNIILE